jgi:hypothetical protein
MLEARSRSFMIGAVLASNHRNDLSSLDTLLRIAESADTGIRRLELPGGWYGRLSERGIWWNLTV